MIDQRVRVKRTATSLGDAWKAGWDSGKKGTKAPDWIDARLLDFAGTEKGARVVVRLIGRLADRRSVGGCALSRSRR